MIADTLAARLLEAAAIRRQLYGKKDPAAAMLWKAAQIQSLRDQNFKILKRF